MQGLKPRITVMHQQDQLIRKFDFTEGIVGLRRDGIVHVFFKPGTTIDIPLQERMVIIYQEVADSKKRPFIFEAAEYCTITREARENALRIESETPCLCSAVFVTSFAYRMIAEFYYKFQRPLQPYKVTGDFNEAIRWLLETEAKLNLNI